MLQPHAMPEIPEETVRVARAAFAKGNAYLRLRDELGPIYTDAEFADLFEWRGRPAESPGFLAMVTVMQFAEGLTDRQTAEAVVSRIDWKYALGLPLTYTGFAHSILHEFRERLLAGQKEDLLLDKMLSVLQERGWIKARGRQRTDSTHVLGAVRTLNRLESAGESVRQALEDLAKEAPDWLLRQVAEDWFQLYGTRFENYRLPQGRNEREALHLRIGQDGYRLLNALYRERATDLWLRPKVQVLRQIWIQQFYLENDQVYVRSREKERLPPAHLLILSPYDLEMRMRTKRQTSWHGFSAHLTETCDDEMPNLIVDVQTEAATTQDVETLPTIHQDLQQRDLLPAVHVVDPGYTSLDHLLASADTYQVELLGPLPLGSTWQARQGMGYDLSHFQIHWETQTATCPQGKQSQRWVSKPKPDGIEQVTVNFARTDCEACAHRELCTTASLRTLTFRSQTHFERQAEARQYQLSPEFKARYQCRAGIEGTISQAVCAFGLRQSRYVGLARTHLQHLASAAAINLARLAAWLNDRPKAQTRVSHFAALAPAT